MTNLIDAPTLIQNCPGLNYSMSDGPYSEALRPSAHVLGSVWPTSVIHAISKTCQKKSTLLYIST